MITIRKYPNRRLYDTSTSSYVNLEHIKRLIIDNKDFEIVEAKSGKDVTKVVLLQILSEMETTEKQPILTETLLKQLICFYDSDHNDYLRDYLEQSLRMFVAQQNQIKKLQIDTLNADPFVFFRAFMNEKK